MDCSILVTLLSELTCRRGLVTLLSELACGRGPRTTRARKVVVSTCIPIFFCDFQRSAWCDFQRSARQTILRGTGGVARATQLNTGFDKSDSQRGRRLPGEGPWG